MKMNIRILGRAAMVAGLALALLRGGILPSWGADREPAERSRTESSETTADTGTRRDGEGGEAADREEPAPRRRSQNLHELVSLGSSAVVGSNQSADQVVVVHGDATIDGEVRGDLVVVFGKVRIQGRVRGDVVVVLGEANVNGRVDGDTSLVMTRSRFGPKAEVNGEIIAVGVPPEVDALATLKSLPEIVSLGPLMGYFEGAKDYLLQGVLFLRPFPPRVGWVWMVAGVFLVLHLFLAIVLVRPLGECMELVRTQPARSFLVGLLACVLVAPVSLLLSFTVIAPLLIWLAFFAVCVFGRVTAYGAAGAALGRMAGATGLAHPVGAVLIGSLALYATYMIPLVGLLVYGLALPLGVGAVLIRVFDALRRETPSAGPGSRRGGVAAANALVSGSPGPATHGFAAPGAPGSPEVGSDAGGIPQTPAMPPAAAATPPPISEPPVTPLPPPPLVPPLSAPLRGVEALASPRVGFWPRLGASAIDLILIAVINGMTFQSAESFWFLVAAYHILFWAWKGTTVGGSVLNLRVVRLDGRPMDWQTAVVRMLGAVVSLVPLGIGFFWASWDAESQSWHDRIAGTTIVKPEQRVSLV